MNSLPVADPWFVARQIDDAITLITEPHVDPLLSANIWHVRGRDHDLLIDTGLGVASLRGAFPDLFRREPIVVVTHGHLDHLGAAHEFGDVRAHRLEETDAQPGTLFAAPLLSELLVDDSGTDEWELPELLISARPNPSYEPAGYRLLPPTIDRRLDEGDRIDLGDRSFRVLHLPGHTPGSIGLLDDHNGVLFSGDVIYDGELIDNCVGANVAAYTATMHRLLALDIGVVHAGHDASFSQTRLRDLATAYVESRGHPG